MILRCSMHEMLPAAVDRQQRRRQRWQLPWRCRGHVKQVRRVGAVVFVVMTMQMLPTMQGIMLGMCEVL